MAFPEKFALDTIDIAEAHQESGFLIPGFEEKFARHELHNRLREID